MGVPVDEGRKYGDQIRLETVVVHTVNDTDWGWDNGETRNLSCTLREIKAFGFRGEYGRKAET